MPQPLPPLLMVASPAGAAAAARVRIVNGTGAAAMCDPMRAVAEASAAITHTRATNKTGAAAVRVRAVNEASAAT
eukprot:2903119-Prymnesium_polylepis.1